ncbi:MAG: AmmeMemoRadiSam system protein B [Thermoplasmata archaeon HGW-Thermoplasmata-1]|nr:MAG: AmmeMemoRadiSam system protein B [Thermoplasmata archaeon HGW-Thermoplasmata-1]
MNVRKASVAGRFYSGNRERLTREIEGCFLHRLGPGFLPQKQVGEKDGFTTIGVVAPHAGYLYSGHIAAHSYARMVKNGFPDCIVIIGPNHTGYGAGISCLSQGVWETPLGKIEVDSEIGTALCGDVAADDELGHAYEHSIEVQLPFIQYLAARFGSAFTFVPICMGLQDYEDARKVGTAIAGIIRKEKRKIAVVASSDLNHVGPNYMAPAPHGTEVGDWIREQDIKAVERILALDAKGLADTVYREKLSVCGYGPIAAMLVAMNGVGAKKAELLKYSTSLDIQPSDSAVGYASIAVE